MAKETNPQGLGLNYDEHQESSGLLDMVDAVITAAEFVLWDYNGKAPSANPALKITLDVDGYEESEVEPHYYSCGRAADFAPSPDGDMLIGISAAGEAGIRKNSNVSLFFKNLAEIGVPRFENANASQLVGIKAHWRRVPAPNREGMKKRTDDSGREFEPTIFLPVKLIHTAEDAPKPSKKDAAKTSAKKGGKKPAAKGKGKSTKPAAKSDNGVLESRFVEFLSKHLENAGATPKTAIHGTVFNEFQKDPDRNALMDLANDPEFMEDEARPWAHDDTDYWIPE